MTGQGWSYKVISMVDLVTLCMGLWGVVEEGEMQLGKAPVSACQSSTVLSLPSLVVIACGVVGWLEEGGMVFKGKKWHHSSSLASCHVGLWGMVKEGV